MWWILLILGCQTESTWVADLQAAAAGSEHPDISSSSRIHASWSAMPGADHYVVTATEALETSTGVTSGNTLTVTGLKSDTTYTVQVRACHDPNCVDSMVSEDVTASTHQEVWQLEGTGHTYEDATHVVDGGNNIASLIHYGEGSDAGLVGLTRLYYHPFLDNGVRRSVAMGAGDRVDLDRFVPDDGFGLMNPPAPMGLFAGIATFQVVPLQDRIRLYLEVDDEDGLNRLWSVDSVDGLTGLDFHPTDPTSVASTEDWQLTDPLLELGLDVDGETSGMVQVRQSKVGWPTLDDWRWDEADGSFLVITGADSCGQTTDGLIAATLVQGRFEVNQTDGCADILAPSAHGPVIVHRGESRYKLYYENRELGNTAKPLQVIYVDGAHGSDDHVESSDWESHQAARDVTFLWPDGTEMSPTHESGLGDHTIAMPTSDPMVQVMYMNLGGLDTEPPDNGPSDGIGIATLINP